MTEQDRVEVAAVWCPHNESFNLCGECVKTHHKTTGGDADDQ